MPPVGPRRGGVEDKGPRLACISPIRSSTSAGSRGQPCPEVTIVTQDKARKSAARRRMAETGEAYAAARRLAGLDQAGQAESASGPESVPVPVPDESDPDDSAADSVVCAGESSDGIGGRPLGDGGSVGDSGAGGGEAAGGGTVSTNAKPAKSRSRVLTPEERFRREAAAAGMPRSEIRIRLAAHRAHTEAARAREVADDAEARAVRAEELAEIAQEEADEAQEWAEDEQDARLARERADELHRATDLAWDQADKAEETAIEAEDQAQLAQERLEAALGRRAMPAPKPMVALPGHLPPLPAVPLLLALPGIAPKLPDMEPLEVPPPVPVLPPVPEPRPLRLPPRALLPRGGQRRLPPGYPPAPGTRR